MSDSSLATPCRYCDSPVKPHCSNTGCNWTRCPSCEAIDNHVGRLVRKGEKAPERGSDGKVRMVDQWETMEYGAA